MGPSSKWYGRSSGSAPVQTRMINFFPLSPGTFPPSHHLHLLDSKEGKHHQACYKRFDLRSVFLLYLCYMDKGNCLSIWQSIR